MAKKNHVLVPRAFTCGDVENNFSSAKFYRMTRTEAHILHAEGKIEPLGSSGKVWQLAADLPAHASRPTGRGRLSLEISRGLQPFIAGEMRRRPSWCIQPIEI